MGKDRVGGPERGRLAAAQTLGEGRQRRLWPRATSVDCPVCGAEAGEACMPAAARATPHMARIAAAKPVRTGASR
jgi:hypothetical protein